MDKDIVISVKTILFALFFGVVCYLIFSLASIIGLISLAFLLAISLEHYVKVLMRQHFMNKNVPRSISVVLVYAILLMAVTVLFTVGLDPVLTQSQRLISQLWKLEEVVSLGQDMSFASLISELSRASGGIVYVTKLVFSNVTILFSFLILSVYISLDWENLKEKFIGLFPDKLKKEVSNTLVELETTIGIWVKGQFTLMLVIGVVSYVALLLLGVESPLALALIAGLLEIVPIIGPIIAGTIAAGIAFLTSPIQALSVIVAFILIQQLEGNILVPKVMEKISGYSPIVILIALLVGGNLFGVIGTIVAVPVLMVSGIVIRAVVRNLK